MYILNIEVQGPQLFSEERKCEWFAYTLVTMVILQLHVTFELKLPFSLVSISNVQLEIKLLHIFLLLNSIDVNLIKVIQLNHDISLV